MFVPVARARAALQFGTLYEEEREMVNSEIVMGMVRPSWKSRRGEAIERERPWNSSTCGGDHCASFEL